MKRLGVMVNPDKPRVAAVLRRLYEEARDAGLELRADADTARLLADVALPHTDGFHDVDAVVTLGGDGTLLRAVRTLGACDKPLLGVNMGKLGFLTAVKEEDLGRAVQALAADDFAVAPCALAEVGVWRAGKEIAHHQALNDIVVGSASARIITLDLHADEDLVTSYVCDAIIIATPAGSTGHSLSAGGPVLTWDTEAFVVSLICPHTLSSRPLVLRDRRRLTVTARAGAGPFRLTVDGQVNCPLRTGDRVTVEHGDRHARLLTLPGYSYFDMLREKLHWSGSSMG
jgi:NAD+ kinase